MYKNKAWTRLADEYLKQQELNDDSMQRTSDWTN